MDVSTASGIRNFIPNPKKDHDEKKTDLQKQLISLSKQDDSLSQMARQKASLSTQKAADTGAQSVAKNPAVPDTAQKGEPKAEHVATAKRFDEFVAQSDGAAPASTGIYSVKKGEDGAPKIVTEQTDIPKAFLKETAEAVEVTAQDTAQAADEGAVKPKAQSEEEKAQEPAKKDEEATGTVAWGKVRFECNDPEHKANPTLHSESKCQKVAEAPHVRPATAAEAGIG